MKSRRHRNQRKHSRSLTSMATTALAAYGAYKFTSWVWNKFTDESENHSASTHRGQTQSYMRQRRQQIAKCRKEVITTTSSFLNTLKLRVDSLTDVSQETKLLKQIRSGQVEDVSQEDLWDTIKVRSITRMIATAYAHTILALVLNVQIHLLGGKIFRKKFEARGDEADFIEKEDDNKENYHQQVLVYTLEYFFDEGLNALVQDLQAKVEKHFEAYQVMNEDSRSVKVVNLQEFDDAVSKIKSDFEQVSFIQYICEFDGKASTASMEEVQFILDETLDVLDSPSFEIAKEELLEKTMKGLHDEYKILFQGDGDEGSKPVVTIVTKLKKICTSFYKSPEERSEDTFIDIPMSAYPSKYLYFMDRMNSVRELGDFSFA